MVDIAVLLALIAIVVVAFTVLPVLVSAAQEEVEVRVNAPEYNHGGRPYIVPIRPANSSE